MQMETFITPLLYIVIAINVILAIVILSRGLGNKVNALFGLIVSATALWGAGILGFYEDLAGTYWLTVTHLSSLFLAYFFYIFTTFYPNDISTKTQRILLTLPIIIIIVAISLRGDLIYSPTGYIEYQLGDAYLWFAIVMAAYFILGFCNLFIAHLQAKDNTTKGQINAVLFGSALAATSGMVTDLIMPYFGIFNYTWLGPFFTIFLVAFMFRAIFKYHLFNIKVIATELLTFILWIFILIRTLIATNLQDRIANGVLLLVSVIIGILLIRSVLKEVHQREEIEALAGRLKSVNRILSHSVKGVLGKNKDMFISLLDGTFGT
ncbi:MAG: histidine kinase N-terminal 7TM domain-containing protein, partial [bacterium]|nr:histidine kinase N-terminal 7TM domain-containing protein [bacterium]